MKRKTYSIIYADFPHKYNARNNPNTRFGTGMHKYPGMSVAELSALDVPSLMAENCAVFFWITAPKLKDMFTICESYGLRYVSKAFTWVKVDKTGKPRVLPAHYVASNTEDCYLWMKGSLKPIKFGVNQVVIEPLRKHSQKPDCIRERIVDLFGPLPRVELFAREKARGWTAMGYDVDGRDIREIL